MSKLPPRKTPFLDRREREFLYLEEVDALIAATQNTRSPHQKPSDHSPPILPNLTTHRTVLAALA